MNCVNMFYNVKEMTVWLRMQLYYFYLGRWMDGWMDAVIVLLISKVKKKQTHNAVQHNISWDVRTSWQLLMFQVRSGCM